MRIVQVVAASCHSLALTQVGEVYSWGDNAWGQIGFPPEGRTDYNSAHASRKPAPAAFGAMSSAFALTAQIKGRKASEIDAPLAFANGVARLWVPTRVVGLSLYKVKALATAVWEWKDGSGWKEFNEADMGMLENMYKTLGAKAKFTE